MTIKIAAMNGALLEPFTYGNVFTREDIGGHLRLRVGVDELRMQPSVATKAPR